MLLAPPIPKKFRPRLKEAIDPYMMFRAYVEICRHWRMVTDLLCEIQSFCSVGEVPFTCKIFPKDRIQWFLHTLVVSNFDLE